MSNRYCKDCRHLHGRRDYTDLSSGWRCGHPTNILEEEVSSVNGEKTYRYRYTFCTEMRKTASEFACGPEGRLFEPQESTTTMPTEAQP